MFGRTVSPHLQVISTTFSPEGILAGLEICWPGAKTDEDRQREEGRREEREGEKRGMKMRGNGGVERKGMGCLEMKDDALGREERESGMKREGERVGDREREKQKERGGKRKRYKELERKRKS